MLIIVSAQVVIKAKETMLQFVMQIDCKIRISDLVFFFFFFFWGNKNEFLRQVRGKSLFKLCNVCKKITNIK